MPSACWLSSHGTPCRKPSALRRDVAHGRWRLPRCDQSRGRAHKRWHHFRARERWPGEHSEQGTNPAGSNLVADTLVFISRDANGAGQFESREVWMDGSVRSGSFRLVDSYGWRDGLLSLSWPVCPLGAFCTDYRPVPAIGRFGSGTVTITYESAGWVTRTFRQVD